MRIFSRIRLRTLLSYRILDNVPSIKPKSSALLIQHQCQYFDQRWKCCCKKHQPIQASAWHLIFLSKARQIRTPEMQNQDELRRLTSKIERWLQYFYIALHCSRIYIYIVGLQWEFWSRHYITFDSVQEGCSGIPWFPNYLSKALNDSLLLQAIGITQLQSWISKSAFQDYPKGHLTRDQFKTIYQEFFPDDPKRENFAEKLFQTYDQNQDGNTFVRNTLI